jgi:copper(I)-binding protein
MAPPRPHLPIPSLLLAVVVALAAVGCGSGDGGAGAQGDRPDDGALRVLAVTIERPVRPGEAVLRLTVRNGTGRADRLVAVSSPLATGSSLHRTDVDDQGRSTMVAVTSVPIAARSTVTFEPGGLHVMLTGLDADRPLALGDRVPVTFTFASAGRRTATATVVRPGSNLDEDHAHDD